MIAELFAAGGVVMGPILVASVAAWWLALSGDARSRRLLRDLLSARELTGAAVVSEAGVGRVELAADDIAGLHQRLRFLAVLVGILPLLGLLGTVSGMIGTFEVIHTMGLGDPRMLAGGIREALVATEAGLATALPALLFHQIVASRLRRVEGEEEILLRRLTRLAPDTARFGEIAVRLGYVTSGDVDGLLPVARERACRIGEVLLAQGKLTPVQRRVILALQGTRHD
ncbi:MAG TPA: MotA/TolQ/ExbB proton channel family protein [Planctomycetota bacterium]